MTVRCKNKILQNSQNYFTYLGYARYYNVENLVHYFANIGIKMSEADQKRFRLKYWVAHSALLSAIWRWMKRK